AAAAGIAEAVAAAAGIAEAVAAAAGIAEVVAAAAGIAEAVVAVAAGAVVAVAAGAVVAVAGAVAAIVVEAAVAAGTVELARVVGTPAVVVAKAIVVALKEDLVRASYHEEYIIILVVDCLDGSNLGAPAPFSYACTPYPLHAFLPNSPPTYAHLCYIMKVSKSSGSIGNSTPKTSRCSPDGRSSVSPDSTKGDHLELASTSSSTGIRTKDNDSFEGSTSTPEDEHSQSLHCDSSFFNVSRFEEKEELRHLNDRFAFYI
ncbi:unnamed protein product, partial [Protopolystoma xenopodis]